MHAYETNYVEEDGEHFQHVWRFADKDDGDMDEIHGLRDKYRADVGVLIVDDPSGCGLATRVYADEDEAFAVVHHECAATPTRWRTRLDTFSGHATISASTRT